MNNSFEVNGLFYENCGHLCRKYLDIKKSESEIKKPDLMVVMMNPGSSSPEDGNDKNTVVSKAVPDPTQNQIMKVMDNCDFNYARILNLSDLREGNSKIFYSKLNDSKDIPHSIFSDERIEDFKALFIKEIPIILAWGVNKKLETLATMAINRIQTNNIFGLLKEGSDSAYYHPLPRKYKEQEEWCKDIIEMLKQ